MTIVTSMTLTMIVIMAMIALMLMTMVEMMSISVSQIVQGQILSLVKIPDLDSTEPAEDSGCQS